MCDLIDLGMMRARRGLPHARVSTAAGLRQGREGAAPTQDGARLTPGTPVVAFGDTGMVVAVGADGRPLVQFGPVRRFVRPADVEATR